MPVVPHFHDWAHAAGGLLCVAGSGCTAFISLAVLQSNLVNTGPTQHHSYIDYNALVNIAWKKSGGT